ncbi:MAG: NUDIX hydrolase [Acidimicrobiales bacterium]
MTFRIHRPGDAVLQPAGDDPAEARRQLTAAALVGADQDQTRQEVLTFTRRHPDCLLRSCAPGHLTGSALVLDPVTGRVLLIHHAKLGRWLQPGGHADGEGNLGLVALTEATEETGLEGLRLVTPAVDIDVHAIGARPGEPAHDHLDLRFVVLSGPDTRATPNAETLGARWVDPTDPAAATVFGHGELERLVRRGTAVVGELRSAGLLG